MSLTAFDAKGPKSVADAISERNYFRIQFGSRRSKRFKRRLKKQCIWHMYILVNLVRLMNLETINYSL